VAPLWVRLAARLLRTLPAGRYRAMDWIPRRGLHPFLMQLPAKAGGYWFECDPRDAISREVCFTGLYEPQETALVRSILRPGMTFVDVGANWGYFTLLGAGLVGESGRVIAIEPDPRIFPILQRNLARNGLTTVIAMQVAASAERGIVLLRGYVEDQGNFGLSRPVLKAAAEDGHFEVVGEPLDALLDDLGLPTIDLLKVDIEGGEGLALKGLSQSLVRHRIHRILLELHPQQLSELGDSPTKILSGLASIGYRISVVDHSRKGTRLAAYSRGPDARRLLSTYREHELQGSWPHVLCTAPGLEPIE
jgi:FkbM family methyltransferase